MPQKIDETSKKIWDFLLKNLNNPYGVAGLMGNLYAESALNPKNLQGSFEKKLGMTDEQYTSAVDSGEYKDFVKDKAGYGLAQWTYWSRKQGLYNLARKYGKSIGDLDIQLEFLWDEFCGLSYKSCKEDLMNAKSVYEASTSVLTKYEKPKNQDDDVKKKRANFGEFFYSAFCNKIEEVNSNDDIQKKHIVTVTGGRVHIRKKDSVLSLSVGIAKRGEEYEFIANNENNTWRKIIYKDQERWISAKYSKVQF